MPSLCTSRFRTSMEPTECFSTPSSRFRSLSLIFSTRSSLSLSWYWIWPFAKMDASILIFSYSSASSSFLRMSWVPRMSRPLTTPASSFSCLPIAASDSLMI